MGNELDRRFYRETVQDSGAADGKVIRQGGGIGVYAHVRVEVRALARGQGNAIEWNAGLNFPARFVPAVLQGIQDVMDAGVLSGFEMADVCVSVEDGSYHDVDSTPDAFREAARMAATEAIQQAQPIILEAMSLITVNVGLNFAEAVGTTVTAHGGRARAATSAADAPTVTVDVPTSKVSGLIVELLQITNGSAKISTRSSDFRQRREPPDSLGSWAAVT